MSRRMRERVSGNKGHNGGIKVGVASNIKNKRGAGNILIASYSKFGVCIPLKCCEYRWKKLKIGICQPINLVFESHLCNHNCDLELRVSD